MNTHNNRHDAKPIWRAISAGAITLASAFFAWTSAKTGTAIYTCADRRDVIGTQC